MEAIAGISFFTFLFCLIYWFISDDDGVHIFIFGSISFVAFVISFDELSEKKKVIDTVTIQEIEYAMNKCSSFGGLKEFRNDVIICMDKTEINMNFEPEKKVEAE